MTITAGHQQSTHGGDARWSNVRKHIDPKNGGVTFYMSVDTDYRGRTAWLTLEYQDVMDLAKELENARITRMQSDLAAERHKNEVMADHLLMIKRTLESHELYAAISAAEIREYERDDAERNKRDFAALNLSEEPSAEP